MKKRGQQLNVTTIIILILAIIVLIVVAVSYTGGWTKLWQKITGIGKVTKGIELNLAIQNCKLYWDTQNKYLFCTQKIEIKDIGEKTCLELAKDYGIPEVSIEEAEEFCG